MKFHVREVERGDWEALRGIFNGYVRDSAATMALEEIGKEEWEERCGLWGEGRNRCVVGEDELGEVGGYAYGGAFRPRGGYERSMETTVYVSSSARGLGLGRILYERLFEELEGCGVRRLYAYVTLGTGELGSWEFHEALGFERVGVMRGVGWKFGEGWDVALYERRLGD